MKTYSSRHTGSPCKGAPSPASPSNPFLQRCRINPQPAPHASHGIKIPKKHDIPCISGSRQSNPGTKTTLKTGQNPTSTLTNLDTRGRGQHVLAACQNTRSGTPCFHDSLQDDVQVIVYGLLNTRKCIRCVSFASGKTRHSIPKRQQQVYLPPVMIKHLATYCIPACAVISHNYGPMAQFHT